MNAAAPADSNDLRYVLPEALAKVFADLDGTPGPVFGSYWQDRADAVLAALRADGPIIIREAAAPAGLDVDAFRQWVIDELASERGTVRMDVDRIVEKYAARLLQGKREPNRHEAPGEPEAP